MQGQETSLSPLASLLSLAPAHGLASCNVTSIEKADGRIRLGRILPTMYTLPVPSTIGAKPCSLPRWGMSGRRK